MIRWTWTFLDRPAATFDECVRFWAAVTGCTVSPPRGEHGEFVTLLPAEGPAWVKMQRVGDAGGSHLDLDVDDVPAAVAVATGYGARVRTAEASYTVLESPAGQTFCFTRTGDARVADPATPPVALTTAPDGTVSRLDQVCLDLSPADLAADTVFWRSLTGWANEPSRRPEFTRLRGDGQPLQFLIQRLDDARPADAHPDFSTTDLAATAAWHVSLGATRVTDTPHWIVLRDPAGVAYCVTARDPRTGRVR